eukprot:CAMPEP_0204519206 /NCGR_PEP_ID=MMETSP0661-20131031/4611_1 /ASSEMBLY_ACC=CAM_ASM_000606 /TAXON_ID=109239 /ORGANISM="Alexandrium margalefi, Strain AMGDE01CS-322" /LENGTH=208 /DNA_ID=CAMNT_0051524701 /DNA_START=54 /DNA_END=680 /DNA_ORIENTATION=+
MAEVTARPDHVFVTELPEDITAETLDTVFAQYGTVLWRKLCPGRGKMAALLQFSDADEAAFLVNNMNGAILHELLPGPVGLAFSEQGPKKKAAAAAGPRMSGSSIMDLKKELQLEDVLPGGQWTNDDGALHIGGLPMDTTDKDVYEIFAPFGAIATRGLKAMMNPDGSCTGVAFVNYLEPESARAAEAALHGRVLKDGKVINVKPKRK